MSQTTTRFKQFQNLYQDSVKLMLLGAMLRARDGIDQASCLMATPANLAQLVHADLAITTTAAVSDLLVVVRGEAAACDEAIAAASEELLSVGKRNDAGGATAFEMPLTSLALGIERAGSADLALISVPGDYAGAEAMKALALGLHVMLFSDNVSVAEELEIKTFARARDLLVMGPDCGTAIVNGVPLGFANVVRRGDIGVVAASGTGLQELSCRIHNQGGGISQALGTGGRDLSEAIGGITMLQGLAALAADSQTRVIVLVSKPPAPAIARRIEAAAAAAGKPVVLHFLGSTAESLPPGLHAASSLCHAADLALALARGVTLPTADIGDAEVAHLEQWCAAMAPSQREVRGLFTGGTFCYEAQLTFIAHGLGCSSNAPVSGASAADRQGHRFIDMGADDHTRGRPHPMIDPSQRDAAVRALGADANVAAIVFDLVLGFGSHDDPAAGLALALADAQRQALEQGRSLALIGHVCGTDGDPQDKTGQVRALQAAGALIVGSNVEAAELAARLAARLDRPLPERRI